MALTKEEQLELINLAQGGRFSGVARRKLFEFREQRGWDEYEYITNLSQALADQGSERSASAPDSDGATSA